MKRNKYTYYNSKQLEFLQAKQKTRILLWGRGTGKNTTLGGLSELRLIKLPRAKFFFSASTYNQILTKTLPPIELKWNEDGFKEDIHYVVGRKPPRSWIKPFQAPRRYENIITFINGYTIEFLSMDRPDLARGGSYDGGDIDEAALVSQEHINKVILPSIRGNTHRFKHYLHQNLNLLSSIPWKPSGYYLFDYELKANEDPDNYFYSEANVYDNIHVLTVEGIARLKREMAYSEFRVECLNERITKVSDGFYFGFDEFKHLYKPKYHYGEGKRGITVEGMADYNSSREINMSLDFSGWINLCTLWQGFDHVEKMFDSLYVKEDNKVFELIAKFISKYKKHKKKVILLWGEPRGHDKNPIGDTLYNQIKDQLIKAGWKVVIKAKAKRTTNHVDRYHYMNEVLSERNPRLPKIRINEESCKAVAIAIQSTQVTKDLKKNKSAEKDRNYPQEHAPHFTDTMDYYIVEKYKWKKNFSNLFGPGSTDFI